MNLKTLFTLLAAWLMLPGKGYAQTLKLGAEGGLNYFAMQRMSYSTFPDTGGTYIFLSGTGFRLGPVAQLSFGNYVHMQSGISLVNITENIDRGYGDTRMRLYYLQVPLNFLFTTGKNKGFLSGFGASYGYAVAGTYKTTMKGSGEVIRESIPLGSKETSHYKRGTVGINTFMIGYRFGFGLYGYVAHSLGVTNITAVKGNKMSGDEYYFTIGYFFK